MPTLLVLAAGMGSRYGGLKQIEPVGPGGETLLDYAVYDALQAGFGTVVFVIRRVFEESFRKHVASRYAKRVKVELVFQSLEDLPAGFVTPAGRTKPWGTAHAVWSARAVLNEAFAAINADDFYGAEAFRMLGSTLGAQSADGTPTFALVGYRLADTLSEYGAVSRGLCEVKAGRLVRITETSGITRGDVGPGRKYSGEELVSMNCWGFTPQILPLLDAEWRKFLADHAKDPKAECYLPTVVSDLVARGAARVMVYPTMGTWFGVTHRDDRDRAAAALEELVERGDYPEKLF